MTLRRGVQVIAIVLGVIILRSILVGALNRTVTVSVTPATETQFLRTYTPDPVVARFRKSQHYGAMGSEGGSGSNLGFATHLKNFDQQLIMKASEQPALMTALDKDMTSQLAAMGAQIISNTVNHIDGIHIRYLSGKSTGTVTINPPELNANPQPKHAPRLPPAEVNIWVRIRIEEKWSDAGLPSQSSASSLLTRMRQNPS